jgi:hypothetical protein
MMVILRWISESQRWVSSCWVCHLRLGIIWFSYRSITTHSYINLEAKRSTVTVLYDLLTVNGYFLKTVYMQYDVGVVDR